MNRWMKLAFITVISTFLFQACENKDEIISYPENPASATYKYEDIKEFDLEDLQNIESELTKAGYDLTNVNIDTDELQTKSVGKYLLKAIKVSTRSPHPDGSGKLIDISGVLLVPKSTLGQLRLVVAPVPTYTYNENAPSKLFKNMSWLPEGKFNYLYFWTLQAYQGFAVLLPDYPGFGDSYGQCFIPYVIEKPMARATIDLTKAAQSVLSANKYRYKSEILVTGYSQGAYVATAFTREIDTNPIHGLKAKLLVAGGTPANLKHMTDIIRHSEEVKAPYLLPYAIWAFHKNGYTGLNPQDVFNEPYATDSYKYFDGTYESLDEYFPNKVSELFTEKIIKDLDFDPTLAYANSVLKENSITPWANKCKIVMVHGISDDIVYYQNAKDFANQQKLAGGNITFHSVLGDHLTAVIPYYLEASTYLSMYK